MSMRTSRLLQANELRPFAVATHAVVEARAAEIDGLRDPEPVPGVPALPARFLRHCDEQTVVGMRAVLRAMAAHPHEGTHARHGIVAASCQAGRIAAARALVLFRDGGPLTVSPHIVPQASLHSIAGAVSVGLGMHGPHLGVSGGPDAIGEGIIAAVSLLEGCGDDLPGVWVVVSEWAAEPALGADGSVSDDPVCRALAFTLSATGHAAGLPVPTLAVRMPRGPQVACYGGASEPARFEDFARALAVCAEGGAIVSWAFSAPGGVEFRVCRRPASARMFSSSTGLREAA